MLYVFLGLRGVSDTINSLMDSLFLISTSQTLKKNILFSFLIQLFEGTIYCSIFFLISSLCVMGVFIEATNCFSPPGKPVFPGVGGCENVSRVQYLTHHARGAEWGRLAASITTGHEMGNLPKTGVVPTTPTLCTCLRGFRQQLVSGHCFHG